MLILPVIAQCPVKARPGLSADRCLCEWHASGHMRALPQGLQPNTPDLPPFTPSQHSYPGGRLPVESARKLRWYDKADLQALSKAHFREKRDLLDTVSALKKVLLRQGLEESKLDAEVRAGLRR